MTEKIKNLKNKITNYLNQENVLMRPRWHFILKAVLKVLYFFTVFLIVLYFISFIALVLREKNFFLLLDMGPGKIHYMIDSLPWLIVFFVLIGVWVLEILVRKFSFSYQAPVLYSLIFVVFLVLITSFILRKIDRHFYFGRMGENFRAPILEDMHKYYRGEKDQRIKKFDDLRGIRQEIKMMNFE